MATSGATHIPEAGEGVRVRNRLAAVRAVDPYDVSQVAEMRYKADITAGALKLPESRLIADLLMQSGCRRLEGRHREEERPSGPQSRHGEAIDETHPRAACDDGTRPVETGP